MKQAALMLTQMSNPALGSFAHEIEPAFEGHGIITGVSLANKGHTDHRHHPSGQIAGGHRVNGDRPPA